MEYQVTGVDTQEKVFSGFPFHQELFCDDVRPYIRQIIDNYGMAEWRAGVLTNEIHGHLGIYAIIGMKMGIRALEELDAEADHVHVISFAGTQPPVSCMNDGLQVSTGATLGHGLISISNDEDIRPEAIFSYNGTEVRLRLKTEYWDTIRNDVKTSAGRYGALTDPYWQEIRAHAIHYWGKWNRDEIFELIK